MKHFDVFARRLCDPDYYEFLAFTNLPENQMHQAEQIAAAKGCVITRRYCVEAPVEAPNFAACVNL